MFNLMENVKVVNSTVRTGVALLVLGGVSLGGYLGYDKYVKPAMEAEQAKADLVSLQAEYDVQQRELDRAQREKEKLATSLKLIKLDRRLAELLVLDKGVDEDGKPYMEVRFSELDHQGNVIGVEREFLISGEVVFIDSWIVSFKDKYVEGGDELRGTALIVFKGIYGELDGPTGAKTLDVQTSAGPPGIYKTGEQNAFEQKIWTDFWAVANDELKQEAMGIDAAYGQANYIKARKGKRYRVVLHASGGSSITPIAE